MNEGRRSGPPRPTVTVGAPALRALMEGLLGACGCPEDLASGAAEVFLEAELRGIGVQGIDYMPYLLGNLRGGNIDPAGRPRIARQSAASALIDGGNGLGQPAALLAADTAARKAREAGAAAVGVTNSQDIFMIGYYAERIARDRCAGIVCTSGGPLVHAQGGIDRVLSTNPIAFGIPGAGEHPIVFDMATSAISNARIRQAAYHREQVPPGSGVGPDGVPTTDAATIRKGAISPLAGHKGFGLSLCVAMLSGPLTGSDFGAALAGAIVGERAGSQGHFMIAIDPRAFGGEAAFRKAAGACVAEIKASRKAPGVDAIRVPGERAFAERERRLRAGIPVLRATWEIIATLATELGVAMPEA